MANQRVEHVLMTSRIIAKILGNPDVDKSKFRAATETQAESGFVHVVEEAFALHPLRVSIFKGQVNDAVWFECPRESGEDRFQISSGYMHERSTRPDTMELIGEVELREREKPRWLSRGFRRGSDHLSRGVYRNDAITFFQKRQGIPSRAAARVKNVSFRRDFPKKRNIQRADINRKGIPAKLGRMAVVITRG